MSELAFRDATALTRMLREREVGSLELTDQYIERIERLDGEVNAVVVRDFARAREAAREADRRLASGEATGTLRGLPMTIKESYDVAGLPTTWGIPLFRDNVAQRDSEAARALRAAGAVFLGKTNVPIHLADFQSYNEIYGVTRNPWALDRTPGGSSGGSSAALAAGLTGLEAGSDIGGSIRNPAHYCGVYGHKPTWGIVPPQGHGLPGVVAGPEPLDRPGWQLRLPAPSKGSLAEFRVALWPTDEMAPVAQEVSDRVVRIGEMLAKRGARVSDQARPNIDVREAFTSYLRLLNPIMTAGLSREQFERMRRAADELDPNDPSQEVVSARAAVESHRDWLSANNARERMRYAWRDFFADWDILICPQTATPAFPHDHGPFEQRRLKVDADERPYFEQLFWAGLITAPYLPSTVFPTGPSLTGLPIGLQAVGAEYDDLVTIDFARLVAREIGGFEPPPGFA